jgi:hypothetical protein
MLGTAVYLTGIGSVNPINGGRRSMLGVGNVHGDLIGRASQTCEVHQISQSHPDRRHI